MDYAGGTGGVQALGFSDLVLSIFAEPSACGEANPREQPSNIKHAHYTTHLMKTTVCEYNDAVIKMVIKERSPQMRHVARTHRVNLDWPFKRINRDPGVFLKFVGTKEQMGDILTKGSFTSEAWKALITLCAILPAPQNQERKTSDSK